MMLVWLLVLFLLVAFAYIVYRVVFFSDVETNDDTFEHNYTFKL